MNKKGITLIALIITIIVLLILAGVSIALVVGDNGIAAKALKAKTKTDIGNTKELINVAYGSALTEGEGKIYEDNLRDALDNEFGENNYFLSPDLKTVRIANVEYYIGGSRSGEQVISIEEIQSYITNNDVCRDTRATSFAQSLKYLGSWDGWCDEWAEADIYRCAIDDNIYMIGNKDDSEAIVMERLNWDGTTILNNNGEPIELITSFGTFQTQNNSMHVQVEYEIEGNYGLYIYPSFNDICILNYTIDGRLLSVQWMD